MLALDEPRKLRPVDRLNVAWMQWFGAPHPRAHALAELVRVGGLSCKLMDGCGPLVWALRQRRGNALRFVSALLDAGFDPNEPQGSMSPLFEACYQRDMKSLRLLLDRGACPDGQGRSRPLGQACLRENDFRFVEELIKGGASLSPGLRFDGLPKAYGNSLGEFRHFRPGKLFGDLSKKIADHAPSQWGEFAAQMRDWAEQVGEPAFIEEVDRWVSMQEASLVLEVSTIPAVDSRPRPRI